MCNTIIELSDSMEYWQSDGDLLTKGLSVSTEYWQSEGVGEDVKGGRPAEGVGEDVEGGRPAVPFASFSVSLLASSGLGFLAAQNAFSDSVALKLEPRPISSSDLLG